jgi:hypothetical protein
MSETKAVTKVKKQTLVLEGDPQAQLDYAQKAAKALMQRVQSKPKQVIIGGKTYLEFGDWQTLARFFGATVGVEWTKPIERNGKLEGYEARAIVYQHGETISAAEASCMKVERNWAGRDEFAVKSMAQTRASAKALRNAFGWVAELAGYSSTPAEEMDGVKDSFDGPRPATDKQKKYLTEIALRAMRAIGNWEHDDAFNWATSVLGKTINDLKMDEVDKAINDLKEAGKEMIDEYKKPKPADDEDVVLDLTPEQMKNGIKIDDLPY